MAAASCSRVAFVPVTGTVTSGAFADLKESENEQQQSRNGGDERQPVSVGRTAAERLYEVGQDLDELQYGFNDLGHAGVYASGAHVVPAQMHGDRRSVVGPPRDVGMELVPADSGAISRCAGAVTGRLLDR